MFHATHRTLCAIELMRSNRFGVDDGHMAVGPAILARHPRYDRQLQHGRTLSRAKIRE
jgi:hypothetical protein